MRFNYKSNFMSLLAVFLFLLPLSVIAKDYPEISKSEHPVFGKQLLEIDPPKETFGAVISPDGTRIASSNAFGHQLFIWDATSGDKIAKYERDYGGFSNYVPVFTPDSRLVLFSALEAGDAVPKNMDIAFDVFDAKTGDKLTSVKGPDRNNFPKAWNASKIIAISRDGHLLAINSQTGNALFEGPNWKILPIDLSKEYPVGQLALSNDGSLLAIGYSEGIVKIFDVHSGTLKQAIQAHLGEISGLIFSKDRKRLFTSSRMALWHGPGEYTPELQQSDNEDARAWDVITGKRIGTYSYVGQFGAADIALSPDEKTLVVVKDFRDSGRLLAFDVNSNRLLDQVTTDPAEPKSASFTADGKTLCVASGNVIVTMNVNNQGN